MRLQSIVTLDVDDRRQVDVDIVKIKSILYALHPDGVPKRATILMVGSESPIDFEGFFAYSMWQFVHKYDQTHPGSFLREPPITIGGKTTQSDYFMGSIASALYTFDDSGNLDTVEWEHDDGDPESIRDPASVAEFARMFRMGTLGHWNTRSDKGMAERHRYEQVHPPEPHQAHPRGLAIARPDDAGAPHAIDTAWDYHRRRGGKLPRQDFETIYKELIMIEHGGDTSFAAAPDRIAHQGLMDALAIGFDPSDPDTMAFLDYIRAGGDMDFDPWRSTYRRFHTQAIKMHDATPADHDAITAEVDHLARLLRIQPTKGWDAIEPDPAPTTPETPTT